MTKKKQQVNPLWGGRFTIGTSDLAQSFSSSINTDKRLFEVDIKGSVAYAETLKEAGLISSKELSKIKAGLKKILEEIKEEKFTWESTLEDVHMNIESRLVEIAGSAAKKIHTGRSRNDQIATDLRMYLELKISNLFSQITFLQETIINLSLIHI